jgi:hypothetical protein
MINLRTVTGFHLEHTLSPTGKHFRAWVIYRLLNEPRTKVTRPLEKLRPWYVKLKFGQIGRSEKFAVSEGGKNSSRASRTLEIFSWDRVLTAKLPFVVPNFTCHDETHFIGISKLTELATHICWIQHPQIPLNRLSQYRSNLTSAIHSLIIFKKSILFPQNRWVLLDILQTTCPIVSWKLRPRMVVGWDSRIGIPPQQPYVIAYL